MDSRSLKIFMACLLGAGIGAFVALQMGRSFWWIGALVGGLIGYLSYDFKEVAMAVPRAWRSASGWRPLEDLKEVGLILFVFSTLILLWGSVMVLLSFGFSPPPALKLDIRVLSGMTTGFFVSVYIIALVFAFAGREIKSMDDRSLCKLVFCNANPITVCFWHLPRGCWHAVKWSVLVALPAVARFLKELFLLVHSDIRLLCGLDAALGSAIGYFAGNAFIGAIAGGLFGVANFELLSKRVLKMVPIKEN